MSPDNFFYTEDIFLRKCRAFWFNSFAKTVVQMNSPALDDLFADIRQDALDWTQEEIQKERAKRTDFVIGSK